MKLNLIMSIASYGGWVDWDWIELSVKTEVIYKQDPWIVMTFYLITFYQPGVQLGYQSYTYERRI